MTEEIVFEEKQPANEVMSREALEAALGSPSLRKACLRSSNPELHLRYLNTVIRWYELEQGYNTQTVEFEEDINFLDSNKDEVDPTVDHTEEIEQIEKNLIQKKLRREQDWEQSRSN